MSDQSGVAGGIDDTCGTTRRGLRGTSVRRGGLVKWGYWAGAWPDTRTPETLNGVGKEGVARAHLGEKQLSSRTAVPVGVGVRSMGRRDTGEQQGFPAEVEAPYYAQVAVA